MKPILEVRDLTKIYHSGSWISGGRRTVRALRGVSFSLQQGQTLALVGESGCGKSTLARVLMRLEPPDSGNMILLGRSVEDWSRGDWQKRLQMIFQDPLSSLNPRKRVFDLIAEPLQISRNYTKKDVQSKVLEMMECVGLRRDWLERYPHMLSGGQRQRVGIARALTLDPQILICDEPVSALDVSLQAQVLNLLLDLQDRIGLSYLFISHDLSVVRHISHRVVVMYLGKIVEEGDREQVLNQPRHPYSQALLRSHPSLSRLSPPERVLFGEIPSASHVGVGCAFASRCPTAEDLCHTRDPAATTLRSGRFFCHVAGRQEEAQ